LLLLSLFYFIYDFIIIIIYYYCLILLLLLLLLLLFYLTSIIAYFIACAIFGSNGYVFFLVCIFFGCIDCVLSITFFFLWIMWIYCNSSECIKVRIWLSLMYDHVILCG